MKCYTLLRAPLVHLPGPIFLRLSLNIYLFWFYSCSRLSTCPCAPPFLSFSSSSPFLPSLSTPFSPHYFPSPPSPFTPPPLVQAPPWYSAKHPGAFPLPSLAAPGPECSFEISSGTSRWYRGSDK